MKHWLYVHLGLPTLTCFVIDYQVNEDTLFLLHRCVKVKSGKIVVELKLLLNKTSLCRFINLSPSYIIFSIPVNNDKGHMSYRCGWHGHNFGGNWCFTIDTKLLYYEMGWRRSNTWCTALNNTSLTSWGLQHSHKVGGIMIPCILI